MVSILFKGSGFMRVGQNIYKRKDGRWEGRYFKGYDDKGKIKYSSVYAKTYKEVREKLQNIQLNSNNVTQVKADTDFKSCCYGWLSKVKHGVKESTYSKYLYITEKYIIPCFEEAKLSKLNENSIDSIAERYSHLSPKTLKDITAVFKAVVDYANRYYNCKLRLNSCKFKKSSDKVAVFSLKEQAKLENYLLRNCGTDTLGVLLCLYTGLRIGEVCALKCSDINIEMETLTVDKAVQRIKNTDSTAKAKTKVIVDAPKSQCSVRVVPIPNFVAALLKQYIPAGSNNYYFLSKNMNYIEPRCYQYRYKKILEKAGVEYINFHALRHTFATRAIEKGVDIKSLSEILGHASVNITLEKYVHSSDEQKKKQINKLELLANL